MKGLNDYYNNYLGKRRINNSKKMEQRAIQYEEDVQVLFDRGFTRGKLLDVGCNGGFFLSALGNQFDRYGTEIDPRQLFFSKIIFRLLWQYFLMEFWKMQNSKILF